MARIKSEIGTNGDDDLRARPNGWEIWMSEHDGYFVVWVGDNDEAEFDNREEAYAYFVERLAELRTSMAAIEAAIPTPASRLVSSTGA